MLTCPPIIVGGLLYLSMATTRTIYRQIDSKLITPEMYRDAKLDRYTSHLNAWRDAFLSTLSDLGVSMQEFQVREGERSTFLSLSDRISTLGNVFPANTYGYGYSYMISPTPSDDSVVFSEYPDSTKYVAFHFVYNGITGIALLLVDRDSRFSLLLSIDGGAPETYYVIDKYSNNKSSDSVGTLLLAVLEIYAKTGKLPKANTLEATQNLITTYQQSQKGASKKKVKSSSPQLTQHDIETLLSSSSPSHVFWSPLLNRAAVKDSRGWYIVSFRHLNSGWTLDWFTLSATPVQSKNGRSIYCNRNGHLYSIPIG